MIRDILTRNALNISIGASGTNKTIWELQSLEAMSKRSPAFDHFECSGPLGPVYYAAFDRTEAELEAKFQNISIPARLFRYKSYQNILHKFRRSSDDLLFQVFKDKPPDTELMIIDGIGYACPDVISQWGSSKVISLLQDLRGNGLTLKIIHHTPKVKGSDRYEDPREKGLGSGTWCQMSNTAIVFEKLDPKDVSNYYRRIWVLHNDPRGDREYAFRQEGGRLIYLPEGFPQQIEERSWSINEIAAKKNLSQWNARKEWGRIRNRPVEDDEAIN